MGLSTLKKITGLFAACVVGIILSFAMTVYTAIQEHHAKAQPSALTLPTPAM